MKSVIVTGLVLLIFVPVAIYAQQTMTGELYRQMPDWGKLGYATGWLHAWGVAAQAVNMGNASIVSKVQTCLDPWTASRLQAAIDAYVLTNREQVHLPIGVVSFAAITKACRPR
jgi:hypothetical protein